MESLGFIAKPSGMIDRRRANVNRFCEDGELTQPVFVRRLLDALYLTAGGTAGSYYKGSNGHCKPRRAASMTATILRAAG